MAEAPGAAIMGNGWQCFLSNRGGEHDCSVVAPGTGTRAVSYRCMTSSIRPPAARCGIAHQPSPTGGSPKPAGFGTGHVGGRSLGYGRRTPVRPLRPVPQGRCYARGSFVGILVLPDPDDGPPQSGQAFIRVAVPTHVCLKLGSPPFGVALRPGSVDRAPVPEATIHKHGDTLLREDHVGRPRGPRQQPTLQSEAQSHAVQGRAERPLGIVVSSARALHAVGHTVVGCWRMLHCQTTAAAMALERRLGMFRYSHSIRRRIALRPQVCSRPAHRPREAGWHVAGAHRAPPRRPRNLGHGSAVHERPNQHASKSGRRSGPPIPGPHDATLGWPVIAEESAMPGSPPPTSADFGRRDASSAFPAAAREPEGRMICGRSHRGGGEKLGAAARTSSRSRTESRSCSPRSPGATTSPFSWARRLSHRRSRTDH